MSFRKKFNNVLSTLVILWIGSIFIHDFFFPKTTNTPVKVNTVTVIKNDHTKSEKTAYDFLAPKEGTAYSTEVRSKKTIDKREKISKTSQFFNGYNVVTSANKVFSRVAPSGSKGYYFANAYLNGYIPYYSDSVWQPLELLRTRLRYELDEINYKGRAEVWQTSKASFQRLRGDCEDHAIVLADWLIGLGYDARVVIGKVQFRGQSLGGHAWVVLFDRGKEYLLEATNKTKWGQLPLAKSLPYYYPKYMFNRKEFWRNEGSVYTVKYSGEKWKRVGTFVPYNKYYPDLHKHALYIEMTPADAAITIENSEEIFYQGIALRTGEYDIEISKEGYQKQRNRIYINEKDLHLKKDLVPLL